MSYNSNLQSKITRIQSIIDTVNELPAVGNGGEQATPIISINTSGLITATAGLKTATKQLAFQPAKTITPSITSQIAVSSGYYTGGNITVAGDSNLIAGNIKNGVSIFGVNGTLMIDGSVSNEEEIIAEFLETDPTIIENSIVTKIRPYAFYGCSRLTTASFPACTTMSSSAFAYCSSLTTVSFPVCTSIGSFAFNNCSRLTTVSFPACITIGGYAFYYCSSLTTVSFPVCTTIGSSAFYYCSKLTTVSFPVCTTISSYAFCRCSRLTTASFPICTTIHSNAFAYCSSLTTASFPACTTINREAFYGCSNLTTVSFPVCTTIGNFAFQTCHNLSSLTLGASTVCTLANSSAFSSTPYAGYSSYFSGTPHIYVPISLVSAYQNATNWTYFSSYFSSIESLESNLITFTIGNVECQAEEGMTWGEWCESKYNTSKNYVISGDTIVTHGGGTIKYNQQYVLPSEQIVPERVYTPIVSGAGGQ